MVKMKTFGGLFFGLFLLVLGCEEKITYIEIPVEVPIEVVEEEEEEPYVTISVVSSSTKYVDGVPFIGASGRVKNHGPGDVINVRVVLTSNEGFSRTVTPSPRNLPEGSSGSWQVSGLQGRYIQYKEVLFSVD